MGQKIPPKRQKHGDISQKMESSLKYVSETEKYNTVSYKVQPVLSGADHFFG